MNNHRLEFSTHAGKAVTHVIRCPQRATLPRISPKVAVATSVFVRVYVTLLHFLTYKTRDLFQCVCDCESERKKK